MQHDIDHRDNSDGDRLAMLETRAAELERMLLGMSDTDNAAGQPLTDTASFYPVPFDTDANFEYPAEPATDDRTEELVARGRPSAKAARSARRAGNAGRTGTRPVHIRPAATGATRTQPGKSRRMKTQRASAPLVSAPAARRRSFARAHWRGLLTAGTAFAVAAGITTLALSNSGPGWPASVAAVKSEIKTACQNADVPAEPTGVNFACTAGTDQVLWTFALLGSGDNPAYVDQATGRKGLEPIQPAQGGDIAFAVNLHHPYNALNAVDSLTVAARAINNIIGGATLTSSTGAPSVQPGLESTAANCARYTGSSALRTKTGYPATCAKPLTVAGEQALVADVYAKWMPSASAATATDAGTLFANANDPGNPKVQAILSNLPGFGA
jgi:hypothetical protein